MNQKEEYVIRVLPEPKKSVQEDAQMPGFWKIKGYTFPDIPIKFRMREVAARFAQSTFLSGRTSRTYVVLHITEKKISCLYVFRFHFTRSGTIPSMCRCVGTKVVKSHCENITQILNTKMQAILALKELEYIKVRV